MAYVATTLRPGFLVSLKTSITGNVKYAKNILTADTLDKEVGSLYSKWETERTVRNAAEQEAATKVRSKVRTLISSPCSLSSFGLLCPDIAKPDLDKAVADARKLADDFNKTATVTRLTVHIMAGKIAPDDVEAIRAINSEVTDLIDTMKTGLETLDVSAVREAANRVKQLGAMLNPTAQAQIQIAVDAARSTARRIVSAGEQAAQEIDRRTLQTLAETRTAFLDIDQEQREIAAPAVTARALDLPAAASVAA